METTFISIGSFLQSRIELEYHQEMEIIIIFAALAICYVIVKGFAQVEQGNEERHTSRLAAIEAAAEEAEQRDLDKRYSIQSTDPILLLVVDCIRKRDALFAGWDGWVSQREIWEKAIRVENMWRRAEVGAGIRAAGGRSATAGDVDPELGNLIMTLPYVDRR
jgi:hypothetical protein